MTMDSAAPAVATEGARRLYRRRSGRLLAGVARGLADHVGVDVLFVRLVFVGMAAMGGAGVLAYALFWIFAPLDPRADLAPADRGRDLTALLALGALTIGGLLLLSNVGLGVRLSIALPLVAVGAGVALLWRQADDDSRTRWRQATGTDRWWGTVRLAGGIALVVLGLVAVLVGPADLGDTAGGLVAAGVVATGVALVSSPWWIRMARDLAAERSARIREQERAEVAAHVHDSVLHTLALIQRHVDDPQAVTRLARSQERELRGWLYRPRPDASVSAALERVAADVEDAHGATVEVVVVGDGNCPLDEGLAAVRDATREALVNAAKYAAPSPVTVYAEVEPDKVTVFVRDRGPGFDPDTVPADRLGLRESVVGRMTRHGGQAVVRSVVGEGTEVQLEMPRNGRNAS